MATIVDSYSESNYSLSDFIVKSPGNKEVGQSFTGDGGVLNNVKFYLAAYESLTGSAYAYIYAETHTTAFGTDSITTGSVLATSEAFDVSVVSDVSTLHTFTFSGENKITLTNGAYYVVVITYQHAATYGLYAGYDGSSPAHSGNAYIFTNASAQVAYSDKDVCFYVYKDDAPSGYTGPFPTFRNP